MYKLTPIALAVSSALFGNLAHAAQTAPQDKQTQLKAVVVEADLRETTEQQMPTSVTVETQAQLQDQGASHFDDILLKTPNVNFSGQSSRARHIQIRGMGERDEYTGAPNSSVGFAIDDIDFSGIGMAASAFDVKQIEVLRGPQNTRYGQSSIAGLINVESNDPTPYRESMVEVTAGQDELRELGVVTSGPISDKENAMQYRFSLFKHDSNGFRDNQTLNKNDTNGRDELTIKSKLRFFPSSATTIDMTFLHANLDNGYDAWSRDNSFNTRSNEPGKDTLLANAAALKVESSVNPNFVVTSKTSYAANKLTYSFDEDWTEDDWGTYLNDKTRKTFTQELRLTSTENSKIAGNTDWLAGVYFSNLDEENQTEYYGSASTDYQLQKVATFGQLDYAMNSKATVSAGLRFEHNASDFTNSAGESFSPDENLWGAHLTYSYRYNATHTAFTGITRGYKAGGFNPGLPADAEEKYLSYDAETLINYEVGLKSNFADKGLTTSLVVFYMDRHNPQFDGYSFDPATGTNWVFFTENLDSAQNYGIEADFNWDMSTAFTLYGNLGLIHTTVNGTPLNSAFTIDGREQAHAPNYQANLGAKYRAQSGWYTQADITAVDEFYFDNTHNLKSDAYTLVNARVGYETEAYEVYFWGKNLTDETYATRGYENFFGDPGIDKYIRLGDPRQFGITARVYF